MVSKKFAERKRRYAKRKSNQKPRGIEIRILEVLATKKTSWTSELLRLLCKEKIAKTRKTVKKAVHRLEQKMMINATGDEKSGAPKPYKLTTYGLFMAFYYQEQRPLPEKEEFPLWEKIKTVAEVHRTKIPLVLGKWDFFEGKRISESVFESLCSFFAGENMPYLLFYQEQGLPERVLKSLGIDSFQRHEESLVKKLTRQILFPKPTPLLISEEKKEWRLILLEDPDLKEFIKNEITHRHEYHKAELSKLRSWKDYIEKVENSKLE